MDNVNLGKETFRSKPLRIFEKSGILLKIPLLLKYEGFWSVYLNNHVS